MKTIPSEEKDKKIEALNMSAPPEKPEPKKPISFYLSIILGILLFCSVCSLIVVSVLYSQKDKEAEEKFTEKIVFRTLNEKEKKVNQTLFKIRDEFKNNFPNERYSIDRLFDEAVWDSDLYKFAKSIPKGSDLHVHSGAFMDIYSYINMLVDDFDVYYYTKYDKDKLAGEQPNRLFKYFPNPSEVEPDYINLKEALNDGSVTMKELSDYFRTDLHGKFREWDYFEDISNKRLKYTKEQKELYFQRGFEKYIENNIYHVEPRVTLDGDYEGDKGELEMMRRAYYKVKEKHPEFTVSIFGVCVKTIYDASECEKRLNIFAEISKELLDKSDPKHKSMLCVGIDLVGEEDMSLDITEYFEVFKRVLEKQPNFKISLHAGESHDTSNDNVIDAYTANSKRIGHSFNLFKYPHFVESIKEKNILLEVCPVSNYALNYIKDFRSHPAINYLRNGVLIALASDDPVKLEHAVLTDDFFEAILSWDLDLSDLKYIIENSITYSFLDDYEKDKLMKAYNIQWENFINSYQ